MPVLGMEKELTKAVREADTIKVQQLLAQLNNPEPAQSATALLASKTVDLNSIQQLTFKLLQEKHEAKDTLHNIDVYKRFALGITTMGIGLYTIGYYFYQSAAQGKSGSMQNFLSIIVASGSLIGHGGEQMRLGYGNHDAINAHAKYTTITQLIEHAKQSHSDETI